MVNRCPDRGFFCAWENSGRSNELLKIRFETIPPTRDGGQSGPRGPSLRRGPLFYINTPCPTWTLRVWDDGRRMTPQAAHLHHQVLEVGR